MKLSENLLMPIIVTGCAGFIGYHVSLALLHSGHKIIGIDCVNDYYSKALKNHRLHCLSKHKGFLFDNSNLSYANLKYKNIDTIIHLAAQAGVRHSINKPFDYIDNNINAFQNIIEFARNSGVKKFIYASSSSVYGDEPTPWLESMACNNPASLYAATKKANEMVAESYANLFGLKSIGLRFFTVYGDLARPDMFLSIAAKSAKNKEPINLFCAEGSDMIRNFTHVDDIVSGIISCIKNDIPDTHMIFNLGGHEKISIVETAKKINDFYQNPMGIRFSGKMLGDIGKTEASIGLAKKYLYWSPKVSFDDGLRDFLENRIDIF